jgi:hypothetical protein
MLVEPGVIPDFIAGEPTLLGVYADTGPQIEAFFP